MSPGPSATAWSAPVAHRPIDKAVRAPGSKSATNRALVLAALAEGPSHISGALDSRDTSLMQAGLRTFGVGIEASQCSSLRSSTPLDRLGLTSELAGSRLNRVPGTADQLRVTPPVSWLASGDIDCGLAGTVMRFLPPIACLAPGSTRFHGDEQAQARPLDPLLNSLVALGASVDRTAGLPFTLTSSGTIRRSDVCLDSSASSQFITGLLLVGARCEAGLTIRHVGPPVPSKPHVNMTLTMLQNRGVVAAEIEPDVWRVEPGPIAALDEWIEPDLTNLATFMAAVGVTGGTARFAWPEATTQAGEQILATLQAFGIFCTYRPGTSHSESSVAVTSPGLTGADIDLHDVSELTCAAAAIAALATGPTRIRGVAHIRGHETDRLAALAEELTALGGDVTQTDDGLLIEPRPLHGGLFHTHQDHRLAHAAALIGLGTPGVVLDDVSCTTKTLPDFVGMWQGLVA